MSHNSVTLEIVDRHTSSDINSVDYLPFGVKVLKLRVRRNIAETLPPIHIRPKRYRTPDNDAPQPDKWRVYGMADDDDDLWIAWGAGDERGFS